MMNLKTFHGIARAAGAAPTHVAKVATYGTRHAPTVDASDPIATQSASGTGLESVYSRPTKKRPGGAPALKRQRSA